MVRSREDKLRLDKKAARKRLSRDSSIRREQCSKKSLFNAAVSSIVKILSSFVVVYVAFLIDIFLM